MVIYADVLASINLLITYIFIVCVRVFSNVPSRKWGVALGSLVGGVSAFIIFFSDVNGLLLLLYKLLIGAIIIFLSFPIRRPKVFLKLFASFLGITFLFGGVIYCVEITLDPHNIFYYNGTVYFDMTVQYLVGFVFLIYGAFLLFDYFLSRSAARNEIYNVEITFRGITVTLRGMVDTGNNMRDSLSGNSVFIAELSGVLPFLFEDEIEYFKGDLMTTPPKSLSASLRLLPCKTVSGRGLMGGIIPERIVISAKGKKQVAEKTTLAISREPLSVGDFDMLLNRGIYDDLWEDISDEKTKCRISENKN